MDAGDELPDLDGAAIQGDAASTALNRDGASSPFPLNVTYNPGFGAGTRRPRSIQVTFSGELFGEAGLPFPPASSDDPAFVDGWTVRFDEFLMVLGNIRVSPGAAKNPDQSKVDPPVARKPGPFVVDVHKATGLVGADGVEPAGALFKWDNLDNGKSFDTGERYAFSYDVQPAAYPATQVNLTSAQFADYDLMVKNRWSKLVRGTATFTGTGVHPDPVLQAKFEALPKTVSFLFGWNDAGSVLNCQNPELGEENEARNRGLIVTAETAATAQITVHVDHLFWDTLRLEGAPLRFDPIAAWAPADTSPERPLLLQSLKKPLAATFADGTKLPDRGPYQTIGFKSSRPDQVSLDINGTTGIADIADFLAFAAQSQMHMNADGLCYVVGQQPHDPFYQPAL